MKALTRKEAQTQFEFLMALEKLDRVLNGPRKAERASQGAGGEGSSLRLA